jgi:hypothetical protein
LKNKEDWPGLKTLALPLNAGDTNRVGCPGEMSIPPFDWASASEAITTIVNRENKRTGFMGILGGEDMPMTLKYRLAINSRHCRTHGGQSRDKYSADDLSLNRRFRDGTNTDSAHSGGWLNQCPAIHKE